MPVDVLTEIVVDRPRDEVAACSEEAFVSPLAHRRHQPVAERG